MCIMGRFLQTWVDRWTFALRSTMTAVPQTNNDSMRCCLFLPRAPDLELLMIHVKRDVQMSRSSSPRMALMRLLISSAVTQVSVGYKIASRWVVNVPVFATHGICISTYATPGLGQGIGGLTDFSFAVASPPADRLAESKKGYGSDFEDAIDEVIGEFVAAERRMTMKNHPIWQPRSGTMGKVDRSINRFRAFCFHWQCDSCHWHAKHLCHKSGAMVAANAAFGASHVDFLFSVDCRDPLRW